MKKRNKILASAICFVMLMSVFTLFAFANEGTYQSTSAAGEELCLTLTADESVDIVKDGKSEYKIFFAQSDSIQSDSDLAMELSKKIKTLYGLNIRAMPDSSEKEDAYEILFGSTNRAFSNELTEDLKKLGTSEDLCYIIAERDGKLAFVASNGTAFSFGADVFLSLLGEDSFTVEKGLRIEYFKSRAEYDKELADKEAAEKAAKIQELKDKIENDFDEVLGGERTPMPAGQYQNPETYPTKGQHPRLNLTADMIPEIKALLEDPAYAKLANKFWADANYDEDGILPDVSTLTKTYNWDGDVLARIEAKALAYLLTGDELYAYQAIYAMKNHMITLTLSHDLFTDLLRPYGWSMMVAGEVYDWCYDLMTEEDKAQFVYGVQKFYCEDCPCGKHDKMTMGFPPSGGGSIQGHGTNVSLHRDYISFSIAIYDECPDWWNFVGGRFYQDYVRANNVYYAAGISPQGTNCYVWGKFYAQIYAAWLVKTMSGVMPYDSGIEDAVYGLMGLRLPNGNVFQYGDGAATATGHADDLRYVIYIAQALFPSEIIQRNARILTNNYTSFSYGASTNYITPSTSLIFRANGYKGEVEGEKTDDTKLIWYYGSPVGQMTVRNDWSEDAAAVFMRIGELTSANHEHEDAGTFQIYYKGCFTSESGRYGAGAGYGTTHHTYWAQSTIAHNGLLVYNPNLASTDKGYYSGGQTHKSAPSNGVDNWLTSSSSKTGEITGYDYYTNPKTGRVDFAYLSGDISVAYPTAAVEVIERRMLTVYTDDEDFPMFFFVYDYMVSDDPSYQKSFLMHTVTEPTINGNVASFVQEGGKIVLTTLTEDAVMTKIGGAGNTYWVNDKVGNLNKDEAGTGSAAGSSGQEFISDGALWGRVQINNTGKATDHLFNVIYVTDADNDTVKTPSRFENDKIIGTQLDNVIAVFAKTESRNRAKLEFTSTGKGFQKYYVSGLSKGNWIIKVDGINVANSYCTEESGLITFTAPAGNVTVEPGDGVRGANTDDIKFELNGAELPEGTATFYTHDVEFVLPELPSTPDREFAGWYASASSSEQIYKIPVGTRGTFTAYAKFYTSYVEDYETNIVNVTMANKAVGHIDYRTNKTGANFKTVKDEDGNTYLLWSCGEQDPEFWQKTSMSEFLADRMQITYMIDIARDGDNPVISSNFRLRGDHSKKSASVFRVNSSGEILLAGSVKVMTITKEFQTLIVSVDFSLGKIYGFDKDGNILGETNLVIPSAAAVSSAREYRDILIYLYDWYSGTQSAANHALRIDNIKVSSGFPANAKIPAAG